jgi:SAM-dependent methyltransferase
VEREILGRDAGRRLFGEDAAGYDAARPGHAGEVYEILRDRCGLRPGSKVVEVGPGTGQATRWLLELGAYPLVALEPDPALAEFLRARFERRIEMRPSTLEAAELEDDFDLAAAASSFHWVDEDVGLAKFRDALRPGGWVALWWTAFGDARRPDPFRDAVDTLMRDLPRSPSEAKDSGPPFAHDGEARVAALDRAGFDTIEPRRIEWTHTWDTAGIRGLFASFSPIRALAPDRRGALLDEIGRVADEEFDGRVTKPIVTALYTACKPA